MTEKWSRPCEGGSLKSQLWVTWYVQTDAAGCIREATEESPVPEEGEENEREEEGGGGGGRTRQRPAAGESAGGREVTPPCKHQGKDAQ